MKIRAFLALLLLTIASACSKQAEAPAMTAAKAESLPPPRIPMVDHTIAMIDKSARDPMRLFLTANNNPNKKKFEHYPLLEFEISCTRGKVTITGIEARINIERKQGWMGQSIHRQIESFHLLELGPNTMQDKELVTVRAPTISTFVAPQAVHVGFNNFKIEVEAGQTKKFALAVDLNLVDSLTMSGDIVFLNATDPSGRLVPFTTVKGEMATIGTPRSY